MTVGDNLKKLRKNKGLSLRKVQKATGISYNTLGSYERNTCQPTIENIYNKEMRKKVASVYESENNYLKFAESVREEIFNLQKKTSMKFFFILPDFSDYYNSRINYKDRV